MNEEQHFSENKEKTKRHRQPKSLSQRLRDKQASLQKAEASLAQAQSRVDKLKAELEALENQRLREMMLEHGNLADFEDFVAGRQGGEG